MRRAEGIHALCHVRIHQRLGRLRPGIAEDIADLAFLDHAAVFEDCHAVADLLHHAHLVGDYDDGDPHFLVDLADQLQDRVGGLRVQRAGGFIAQQHLRIRRQRPRDGDALLLAAGQLRRIGIGLVRQSDSFQQGHRPLPGFRPGHMDQLQRQHDVFQAGTLHQQVKGLEDHRDLVAYLLDLLLAQGAQVLAVPDDRAFRRPLQHVDTAHQGALPGAAHSDDAIDVPVPDRQVDMLQRIHRPVRRNEVLTQVLQLNHGSLSIFLKTRKHTGGKGAAGVSYSTGMMITVPA